MNAFLNGWRLLACVFTTVTLSLHADVTGDYRSASSGNWDSAATWETYNGASWVAASTKPGASNPVFVQAGHTVTLTMNEACRDLHVSTGTTGTTTGGDGQVQLATYVLEVNGKLRNYYGVVGGTGNLPGTSDTLSSHGNPIVMTAGGGGKIRIVGNSRTVMNTGEWGSGNSGATTAYAMEIALNPGQEATAQTSFKVSDLLVSSGTLSMSSSARCGLDNGGGANATIASGAVLRSAISGTGGGSQVMSRSNTSKGGTLTINSGGKLELTGSNPRIDMTAFVLNGTVEFSGSTQTLLRKSGNDATAADITTYGDLALTGNSVKSLAHDTTVEGTLSTAGSAALSFTYLTLTLNGPGNAEPVNLVTTSSSTLVFGGTETGVTIPSGVTTVGTLVIANPNGVTLNAPVTVTTGLKLNGGKLGLNYSGQSDIAALSFDNGSTWESAGTYGFTGSGATTEDAVNFITSPTLGVLNVQLSSPPDIYRSAASGNWSSASTWETSSDGVSWNAAATKPGSMNEVFVQAGHVVTLTGNESCGDLHVSTGTSNDSTGGDGQVALGSNILDVYGRLRCYFGTVGGSLPGTSSALNNISSPITITAGSSGRIRFAGGSRVVFAFGEWSSSNNGTTTTYATEVALSSGQVAIAQTVFKTSAVTITSGTLESAFRIGLDKGIAGQGDMTIASGAVFRSTSSGSGSGQQVVSRGPSTVGGALTIASGGKMQLTGPAPALDMSSYVLNGTVEYIGGSQTLARKSGLDAGAVDLPLYGTLVLDGSGTKTLGVNTTVNSNLTMTGAASLALGGRTLTYGSSATLEYASWLAQTTADTEFPATGGPNALKISNAAGVTLNGNKTIAGLVTVTSGADLNFGGYTLTADSASLSGTLTMQINKAAGPTLTASKLSLTSASPLAYGGALTVTATGDALSWSDVFDLFDAVGGFVGASSFDSTSLPSLPVESPALNWYLGELTVDGTLSINRAPVAKAISAGTSAGDSATVLIIGGKHTPTDADGDTLTISSVQNPSANGAAVSTDGSSVTVNYSGMSFSGSDTFTYVVSDGRGGTNEATVTVQVSPAGSGANIVTGSLSVNEGTATMQAYGIPGAYYHLQYTVNLSPPNWQDVSDGDVQASVVNGVLALTDSGASGPSRYYRTRYVSGP